MLNNMRTFVALAVSLSFALPAMAKVTPVHEYNPSWMETSVDESVPCSAKGYFTEIQSNAVCTKKVQGDGTVCYDCQCASKYKYSCSSAGVVPSGDSCTVGGKTKYTACACAAGYVEGSSVTTNLESISYPTPVKDGGIECYKTSGFSCASGYKQFTSNPPVEGVTYKTQTPYTGSSLKCVSGYTKTDEYMTSIPSGYDCMTSDSVYLSSLKNPIYLYYFTGCSDGGNCTNTPISCSTYSAQKGNGITCYKITGCMEGFVQESSSSYLCGDTKKYSASSAYYTSSTYSKGDVSCLKVTGCASSYEKAYIGSKVDSSSYASSGSSSYEIQELVFGTGQLICRMAVGCKEGEYDFSCPSGCWDGYLSWWQ